MLDEVKEALKADAMALAFVGAIIALTFWPAANRRKALSNVFTGTAVSTISVPGIISIIEWYLPTFPKTSALMGAAYFWMGLLGMQIIPVAAHLINRIKNANIPTGGNDAS